MWKPISATTVLLLSACTVHNAPTIDEHFGEAVRHNIAVQTISPEGVADDDSETMDGRKARQAIERHRQAPAAIGSSSLIRVGN